PPSMRGRMPPKLLPQAGFRRGNLLVFLLLEALAGALVRVGRDRTVLAAVRGASLHVLRISVTANAHIVGLGRGRRSIFHRYFSPVDAKLGFGGGLHVQRHS